MPRTKKTKLSFNSIKCKLSTAVPSSDVRERIRLEVLAAHEATKLGFLFFKSFCLWRGRVPEVDHSTMVACLNSVTSKSRRGAKCKSAELGEEMQKYWEDTFSKIYPDRVDMEGRSRIKATIADQMETLLLTNATTHFRSRCFKTCLSLGLDKREAIGSVNAAFVGRRGDVAKEMFERVLPDDVQKNVCYDMKARPSKYVRATFELALLTRGGTKKTQVCFCPLRTSCTPCHVKLDTEAMAQIFVPYKQAVRERKTAEDRTAYNDLVWNRLLDRPKVDRKSRKYRFHHEITTDGVAVTLLYSKESPIRSAEEHVRKQKTEPSNNPPGRHVGLDPGKRNIATMVDENGITLKYKTRQRNHESRLTRYRKVLQKEKRAAGIEEMDAKLSLHSRYTNDHAEFSAYLYALREHDENTREFYSQDRWRGWRFRIYCNRKKSEDLFLAKTARTYGASCCIHYGDWSRRDQMKGCDPSPTVGLRKLISRRFEVREVDEFRTSKTCNLCMKPLCSYRKKDNKLSYSRLCCTNKCGSNGKLSKRFVDRDLNAASNILLAGTSLKRPLALTRRKRVRGDVGNLPTTDAKRIKSTDRAILVVGPTRESSDPTPGRECVVPETH